MAPQAPDRRRARLSWPPRPRPSCCPDWMISLATIAFANGLVVLGLIVLWRAGLVSFGQALYYCIGAYAVALVGRWTGITDAIVLVLIGGACAGARRLRGRLPAGALPRDLFRDAEPRTVHDPLRRAGEDRVARFDRRFQRARADLPRLCAAPDRRCCWRSTGSCSRSARSRPSWSTPTSAPSPARWRFRCATTRSASSFSACRYRG